MVPHGSSEHPWLHRLYSEYSCTAVYCSYAHVQARIHLNTVLRGRSAMVTGDGFAGLLETTSLLANAVSRRGPRLVSQMIFKNEN
jgi:hypothetical protein